MEYKVVAAGLTPELEKHVNKLLAEGWEVSGSLATGRLNLGTKREMEILYQPMLKN